MFLKYKKLMLFLKNNQTKVENGGHDFIVEITMNGLSVM